MGKTAFSGPVYGAKGVLATYSASAISSSGASTAMVASWIVPVYEDWFVTEITAYCSSASSGGNTITVKSEGGSTAGASRTWGDGSNSTKAQTIGTATWGTATSGPITTAVAASAGEYEGRWVPGGSTVRAVLSSVTNQIANLNIGLRGYVRFLNSTRAE